jgi:hypothetical protein
MRGSSSFSSTSIRSTWSFSPGKDEGGDIDLWYFFRDVLCHAALRPSAFSYGCAFERVFNNHFTRVRRKCTRRKYILDRCLNSLAGSVRLDHLLPLSFRNGHGNRGRWGNQDQRLKPGRVAKPEIEQLCRPWNGRLKRIGPGRSAGSMRLRR